MKCMTHQCGGTASGCTIPNCPYAFKPPFQPGGGITSLPPYSWPAPRTMPVNIPLPTIGVTIVTVDRNGNMTIKVDQVAP